MRIAPNFSGLRALLFILSAIAMLACGDDKANPEISDNEPVLEASAPSPEQQLESYVVENGLEDNAERSPSGLVYVIEEAGGAEKPSLSSQITINYHGYLMDGKTFDRSKDGPVTFPLTGLIPAWQEALPLIGKGGKIKILAPPSVAYGNNPPPGTGITRQSVIVFDVELVDFKG